MTPEDPWAAYDAGLPVKPTTARSGPLRLAFYGRCSTEDNQDPETSRNWQLEKARSLVAHVDSTAEIAEVFFDVGFSRSLPWKRRPEAQRLLAALDSPTRTWDAIVVGEGKRCWYGAQFTDVSPIVTDRGVDIFVPELGGRYDPKNASHYTLMTVTGGMSLAERQTVQDRVRAAMQVQVQQEGRWLGGRPPYGYLAVPFALHPNPRKAAEGFKLKRLEVDPIAGPIVARAFQEVLSGRSLRQIARDLNSEGVPCPSAHDPGRNAHRAQNGWQVSTLRAILANQRYTGFATFGAFRKAETLLDPNDPSWGSKTRLVRSDQPLIRSREQVHPALISVSEWQEVQRLLTTRGAGGMRAMAKQDRPGRQASVHYALKGLIRCAVCERRMQADRYNRGADDDPMRPRFVRYRCRTRNLVEGSPAALNHPSDVSLPQGLVLDRLAEWLSALFYDEHRPETVAALVGSLDVPNLAEVRTDRDRQRLAEVEKRMASLLDAVEAGVDPTTVAGRLNTLSAEAAALRAALDSAPEEPDRMTREAVEALVAEFAGAAQEVFGPEADPEHLHAFFSAIGLELTYDHATKVAHAQVRLAPRTSQPHSAAGAAGGANVRVRGGT